MQLECILEDDEFLETKRLCAAYLDDLNLIADVKGGGQFKFLSTNSRRIIQAFKILVEPHLCTLYIRKVTICRIS